MSETDWTGLQPTQSGYYWARVARSGDPENPFLGKPEIVKVLATRGKFRRFYTFHREHGIPRTAPIAQETLWGERVEND